MMTCHDDLLQLYVDGDLQPAEAAVVEAHLTGCTACRRKAGLYKSLFWDLSHAGQMAEPLVDGDAGALADLLRQEWQRANPAPGRSNAQRAALWLTANPLVAGAARTAGEAGRAGLASLGRSLTSRLFGRRGGGGR